MADSVQRPVQRPIQRPHDESELIACLAEAADKAVPLRLIGGGSREGIGPPVEAERSLDLSAFAGVGDYQPAELTLTAAPATPLVEIDKLLRAHRQHLAFEPPDHAGLQGGKPHRSTLGGAVIANASGPRRPFAGAARDHHLGFRAVNGLGIPFQAGGRVVKNVTGYDLCRLMAGSWGTLAVIVEMTVKALPMPETETTLLIREKDESAACRKLIEALKSPCDLSAAAFFDNASSPRPLPVLGSVAAVCLRLEGIAESVAARLDDLRKRFPDDSVERLDGPDSATLWRAIRDAAPFHRDPDAQDDGATHGRLWRIALPASQTPAFLKTLRNKADVSIMLDWGGSLIWALCNDRDDGERRDDDRQDSLWRWARACGGDARLIRADRDAHRRLQALQAEDAPERLALSQRIKAGFDPKGILNPGKIFAPTRA